MSRTPALFLVLAIVAAVLTAAWMLGSSAEFEEDSDTLISVSVLDEAPDLNPVDLAEDGSALLEQVAHESSEREAIAFEHSQAVVGDANSGAPAGSLLAHGRVVDAATSEPLPSYALVLRDSKKRTAQVVTDASGAFAAVVALLPGPLTIRASERSREFDLAAELVIGADGSVLPIELRVESGPTYRLAIAPANAPSIDQLTAFVGTSSERDSSRARGTLGGGAEPWVRFSGLPRNASEGEIVLDSRDGVWRGRAKVGFGRGVQRGIVPIVLETFAALEVRVVGVDDRPIARATVTWAPNPGGRPREQTTGENGIVVWERATPEAGVLSVRITRYLDFELPLVLVDGVRRVEIVRPVRAPAAGSIRGTVVSDTGSYERDVSLRLLPFADGRGGVPALSAKVEWSSVSGARVGRFSFDDLPVGRWYCQLSEDDWYQWEPRRVEVETPRGDLVFVVHDAVPVADLEFEPRDENGAVLSRPFEVRLLVKGEPRLHRSREGRVLVQAFPVDSPLRWRVDADGRAAVFGGWPELAPLSSVGGRERRGAAPILESGWAQTFRVVRQDNSKAIAGATAIVDGRELGVTGADGRIVLHAGAKPKRVQFRFKDWKMRGNASLAPASGSVEFESVVRLEVPKNARKKKP